MRRKIEIFKVGTVLNSIILDTEKGVKSKYSHIHISVPARINAMCFDSSTLERPRKKWIYEAGELIFTAPVYTDAKIEVIKDKKSNITISDKSNRKSIVRHAALLMKKVLNFKESLLIEANNRHDFIHAGFGSSAAIQAAVAIGINILYGDPIKNDLLIKYLSQNYGEEIEHDDYNLVHVQSNGGGIAAALYGGIIVLAGEGAVIQRGELPKGYYFIFGIPRSYRKLDAKALMDEEITRSINEFKKFKKNKIDYRFQTAYNVLHKAMPAILRGDMKSLGEIIEDYRFKSGSLESSAVLWPEIMPIMERLRLNKDNISADILSISSVGPVVFILSKSPSLAENMLRKMKLKVFKRKANNKSFIVNELR